MRRNYYHIRIEFDNIRRKFIALELTPLKGDYVAQPLAEGKTFVELLLQLYFVFLNRKEIICDMFDCKNEENIDKEMVNRMYEFFQIEFGG